MLLLVIISKPRCPEILGNAGNHQIKIVMYQLTDIHVYDIIEASLSVESECQRAVLHTVTEAVLHLIAVLKYQRA